MPTLFVELVRAFPVCAVATAHSYSANDDVTPESHICSRHGNAFFASARKKFSSNAYVSLHRSVITAIYVPGDGIHLTRISPSKDTPILLRYVFPYLLYFFFFFHDETSCPSTRPLYFFFISSARHISLGDFSLRSDFLIFFIFIKCPFFSLREVLRSRGRAVPEAVRQYLIFRARRHS